MSYLLVGALWADRVEKPSLFTSLPSSSSSVYSVAQVFPSGCDLGIILNDFMCTGEGA